MIKSTIYLIIILIFASCSVNVQKSNQIRIKGSDTMLLLTRQLGLEYMKLNPDISVRVEGGGTGIGVEGLIDNSIDICMSSRNLEPTEIQKIAARHQTIGVAHLIAKDGLSFYVHPDNPIDNLELDELKLVLTGKITNWQQLGGNDAEIIPVIRPTNSGTHQYVKLHILENDEYCHSCLVLTTTQEIIDTLSQNVNMIGYGGIGYKGKVKSLKINSIEATVENIQSGDYPVSRYLYFYTLVQPKGKVKDFIFWVLSDEGQTIIENMEYIPLWKLE